MTHAEASNQTTAPPRPGVHEDADIVEGIYDSEIAIPELEGTNEDGHEATLVPLVRAARFGSLSREGRKA